LGLVALKALVLFALGKWAFKSNEPALSMAVVISQGGEFAFVLFGLAVGFRVMERELADLLVVVVSLSMAVTPVLFVIGRVSLGSSESGLSMGIVISQGGEFAFVLFGLAVGFKVMDRAMADLLVVVVSLSMVTTPLLFTAYSRWVRPRFQQKAKREFDVNVHEDNPVIIAGMGRVGQVIARVLRAKHIGFTALDVNPEHIDFLKRFGNKIYYGDASRLDMLRAAHADKAKVFVLAIDDVAASIRTAETVQQHFPHLTIFARARNRQHTYQLLNMGIKHVMRETWVSSLEQAREVLEELGMTYSESRSTIERFRDHDERLLLSVYPHHKDEKKLAEMAAQARKELESLFEQDAQQKAS
ncbi:MAG TPA: NAD-binding protein, partial [Myxococcaceae bacterium]